MGVFLLDLPGNELLIKTCVISIFFVFLIKARCVGRGGGERGAGSQGRREMWSEVRERGNLRQTGRFWAQTGTEGQDPCIGTGWGGGRSPLGGYRMSKIREGQEEQKGKQEVRMRVSSLLQKSSAEAREGEKIAKSPIL